MLFTAQKSGNFLQTLVCFSTLHRKPAERRKIPWRNFKEDPLETAARDYRFLFLVVFERVLTEVAPISFPIDDSNTHRATSENYSWKPLHTYVRSLSTFKQGVSKQRVTIFAWRPASQYDVAAMRGADSVLASDYRAKFGRPSRRRRCCICVTVRLPVRPRGETMYGQANANTPL